MNGEAGPRARLPIPGIVPEEEIIDVNTLVRLIVLTDTVSIRGGYWIS